ncbi:hypothetical protein V494_07289 [Pseudogymnoascus sp. VKM F-4513 (FW-928)]|nr:hypothetical protein V494_07289 [Pseudogymnoascus sp. VKM F-4513 (FW-928)]
MLHRTTPDAWEGACSAPGWSAAIVVGGYAELCIAAGRSSFSRQLQSQDDSDDTATTLLRRVAPGSAPGPNQPVTTRALGGCGEMGGGSFVRMRRAAA